MQIYSRNELKSAKSESGENEEKDAGEGACARSVLKGRFQIGPMKEGFNGLTSRTDREMGTIPGTQNIIALSLFRRNNFNITTLFQ